MGKEHVRNPWNTWRSGENIFRFSSGRSKSHVFFGSHPGNKMDPMEHSWPHRIGRSWSRSNLQMRVSINRGDPQSSSISMDFSYQETIQRAWGTSMTVETTTDVHLTYYSGVSSANHHFMDDFPILYPTWSTQPHPVPTYAGQFWKVQTPWWIGGYPISPKKMRINHGMCLVDLWGPFF